MMLLLSDVPPCLAQGGVKPCPVMVWCHAVIIPQCHALAPVSIPRRVHALD